jgi:FkbM family methyltransferase
MPATSGCLSHASAQLGNLEGAHRVHGWSTPLGVANATNVPMAVFHDIGEPHPYVKDQVSAALRSDGYWELDDPIRIAAAAGDSSLPTSGAFLDVGGGIGSYAMAFARRGFRTIAIEPMTQNVLALRASMCMNTRIGRSIEVVHSAAVSPARAARAETSCAVLSKWRGNDFGNGVLECVNRSGASQCARKHNGATIVSNFTYFFHYRRFCQVVSPRRTLDELLAAHSPPIDALAVVKIDTSGAECDVIAGAEHMFTSEMRPQLLMINVDAKSSALCVAEVARAYGYEVRPIATAAHGGAGAMSAPSKHVVLRRLQQPRPPRG